MEVRYTDEGNPICEICGKDFKRLLSHVRQKHEMNEREYKTAYGLDLGKGICSKESSELSRHRVFENYSKVVEGNLIKKGEKSRFKNGDKGRTKDQVSPQTLKALKERVLSLSGMKNLVENGRKVGSSGAGNKARWGEKDVDKVSTI